MKILYKQEDKRSALGKGNITDCYFKYLMPEKETSSGAPTHHHACFELHAMVKGSQTYEIEGNEYHIPTGSFMIIFPYVPHRVVHSEPGTEKIGITFSMTSDIKAKSFLSQADGRMLSNLSFVVTEASQRKEISAFLIENCILEIIIGVFRMMGKKESARPQQSYDNAVLNLAKQYISDNIESFPSVCDVAEYCYLSAKQLTRIFRKHLDISPGEYIARERVSCIERLLLENRLSLKEISERMSFSSEYYFNAFFKKHWGMPPGTYKKMMDKG